MTQKVVEILLVEDNPSNVELTLQCLRSNNLSNHVEVVRDEAEVLDFIFCTGYAYRNIENAPKVVLLDLMPKVDGLEVLQRVKSDLALEEFP